MSRSVPMRVVFASVASLIAIGTVQPNGSLAQQPEENQRNGRSTRPPTISAEQQQAIFQARAQRAKAAGPEAPSNEPKQSIAISVWMLTLLNPSAAEADELTGQLQDKADILPVVLGTRDDVKKLIGRLDIAGMLRKSQEVRLLAVNGEPASSQFGADEPRIVATSISDQGQTNSVQYHPVGTVVRLTPRIDTEGAIQVGLICNSSDIIKSDDVAISRPAEGKETMANVLTKHEIESTVRLKNGTAVLVWSNATQNRLRKVASETQIIILAAAVNPEPE